MHEFCVNQIFSNKELICEKVDKFKKIVEQSTDDIRNAHNEMNNYRQSMDF